MSQYKNNREHIEALIAAGGATKESLMEATGCSDKSLASTFALCRLTGFFPMKNDDGTFRQGTAEEFEAAKANRTSKPKTERSPKAALDAAVKREERAAKAHTTATTRYEADSSRENELRLTIATAELSLAGIMCGKAQAAYDEADPATRDLMPTKAEPATDEVDDDDDSDDLI